MKLRNYLDHYGSDKNKSDYTQIYTSILTPLCSRNISLLEIGIGTLTNGPSSMCGYGGANYKPGASLRAFRDFLPQADIYGMDIQNDCMFSESHIITYKADSTSKEECDNALGEKKFTVIIDDGLHTAEAQIKTFQNLWPRLLTDGYYFIEDISSSNPLGTQWRDVFEEIDAEKWMNEHKNLLVFCK